MGDPERYSETETIIPSQYIPRYFILNPSMLKFIELLNSDKLKILNNFAVFIIKAFEVRLQVENIVD